MSDADYILFCLAGTAVVVAIVSFFNWPRKKPEPHGFGDPAFNKTLKEGVDRKDFENSLRREVRRANVRRSLTAKQMPRSDGVTRKMDPSSRVRGRPVEQSSSNDGFLTGLIVGELLSSHQSSHARADETSSTVTPGGGSFGGAGASGSWDSSPSSSDSGSSSSSYDGGSSSDSSSSVSGSD